MKPVFKIITLDVKKKTLRSSLDVLTVRIRKRIEATPQDTAAKVVELLNQVEKVLTAEELSPAEKQLILSTVIETITPQDDGVKIQLRTITLEMILVIDNYDSFTYNLVQYLGELGEEVEVVRNDQITLDEIAAKNPDRIVISPGPCTPTEAGISVEVIRRFGSTIPILGVCLGHQAIGQALGGRVVRAENVMHGKTSQVTHHGEGVFAGLPSPLQATRYHSLIIERDSLPDDLHVTAETDDGVIMGVRHRTWPLEGVQFHPESVLTPQGKEMLKNFLGQDRSKAPLF